MKPPSSRLSGRLFLRLSFCLAVLFVPAAFEAHAATHSAESNVTTVDTRDNLDADVDGMPDSWESQYPFLSSTNAADALLDYDGDGLSNLAEYRAGTAPNDPDSYLRMTGISAGGTNGVTVTWGQRRTGSTRCSGLQVCCCPSRILRSTFSARRRRTFTKT